MVRDKQFYRTIFKIAIPVAFQSLISLLVVLAVSIIFMLCIIIALIFVGVFLLFPKVALVLLFDPNELQTIQLASDYMSIVCLSYLPYAVTAALSGMLRAVEVVKVTLYVSLASLFTNVCLNYVLIFGKLGIPALGVKGAAIATVAARFVELAIVWLYTFKVQRSITIKPRDLLHTEKWLIKDYIRYGLPVGLTDMQWSLIGMLKAAIIGQMGPTFMVANGIASSMANLGTMW